MKKLIIAQIMATIAIVVMFAVVNISLLLSWHPAEYYFTLKGFAMVSAMDIAWTTVLLPAAFLIVRKDRVLNEKFQLNWNKKGT